jgi:CheY-like chemotaxis protein
MRVLLIADDDPMVRATLRRMAEDIGYTVRVVANGALACEVCRAEAVDVALIDVIMPGEDGIMALSEIRVERPKLPVVMMSGGGRTGNTDLLCLADRIGADAVLRKPFDSRTLIEAIDDAVARAIARNPAR